MKRAVVLVDHGSRRSDANEVIERVGARVAEHLPDRIVRIAHMELAKPSLAEALEACVAAGAREIVVHPYFLVPGNHSTKDIPEQVHAALASHPEVAVRVTEPLGVDDRIVDLVIERITADE